MALTQQEKAIHAKKHIRANGDTKKEMFDPASGEFATGKNAQIVELKNGRLAVKAEHPGLDHHMYKFIGRKK